MGLTWDEFLKLASVISNLKEPIIVYDDKEIGFKEMNTRVAGAAKDYLDFFNNLKYIEFMKKARISLKN